MPTSYSISNISLNLIALALINTIIGMHGNHKTKLKFIYEFNSENTNKKLYMFKDIVVQ